MLRRKEKEGFSLVEVVLALGIVAFAAVAILGMFPVALGAAKDSLSETHAAMIAQLIVGQLRSQPASGATFAVQPDPATTGGSYLIDLANGQSVVYAVYDESGQPVARVSSAQFATPGATSGGLNATQKAQCVYMVRLTVDANKPAVGFSQITVDVTYPGLAPAAARKTSSFVTLVRNTDT
ncbi:hypothetical protein BH09VER1_BH09VER1_24430 [soil metagenome]